MNKRGVSLMVAYVLLIVIGISIGVLVYSWLKGWIPANLEECPEEVDLIIKSWECGGGKINITLENKGLFSIDGFFLRAAQEENKKTLGSVRVISTPNVEKRPEKNGAEFIPELKPNKEVEVIGDYSEYGSIKKIEVQPFVYVKEEYIAFCEGKVQKVDCS